jgi:membrane protease YdiL (CAAX protease family)
VFTFSSLMLIAGYTFLPATLIFVQGPEPGRTTWLDFAVVVLLWLPLELALGATLIPRPVQGIAHTTAYAIAITLALALFLLFRGFEGMKYRWPASARDFLYPLAGFAAVAPVLIVLGLALDFIAPFHVSDNIEWGWLARRYALILVATALPEEILFRGLIQNWLMQRFGTTVWTLLAASVIFGSAHLNNGPGPPPNWRYMLLATIAGFAYGRVFQKTGSVLSPALLHALVNTIRHGFF